MAYIKSGSEKVKQGFEIEAKGDVDAAMVLILEGCGDLVQGARHDTDKKRQTAVRVKVAQYVGKAERMEQSLMDTHVRKIQELESMTLAAITRKTTAISAAQVKQQQQQPLQPQYSLQPNQPQIQQSEQPPPPQQQLQPSQQQPQYHVHSDGLGFMDLIPAGGIVGDIGDSTENLNLRDCFPTTTATNIAPSASSGTSVSVVQSLSSTDPPRGGAPPLQNSSYILPAAQLPNLYPQQAQEGTASVQNGAQWSPQRTTTPTAPMASCTFRSDPIPLDALHLNLMEGPPQALQQPTPLHQGHTSQQPPLLPHLQPAAVTSASSPPQYSTDLLSSDVPVIFSSDPPPPLL